MIQRAVQRAGVVALAAAVVLASGAGPARGEEAARELPPFVGTWHVLIHYQVPDGPHPDRWKWDERIWVIEPAGDGFEWIEHAIVSFQDPTGRFENLGTNRARRLLGRWEPNEAQRVEMASGLAVSARGARSKRLRPAGPGVWRSDADTNAIGQSSSGLGYTEVWSIEERDGAVHFAIDPRFTISAAVVQQSAGATVYAAERVPGAVLEGSYRRGEDRIGRFRIAAARIGVPESDDPTDATSRPNPFDLGVIDMVPDREAKVPLVLSVLRPFHYYADRHLTVDSSPPGAELDIAYLRRGSQLLYKRGRAPVELQLPTRLQSAPSDRLLIRGFLPGHERTRRSLAVLEAEEELLLELPPLQNQLVGVAHGSIAGRAVLELRTAELPTVRVADDEKGWTVVLVQTGLRPPVARALGAVRDPALNVHGRQLGDDLVVRIDAPDPTRFALRQTVLQDPSRGETRTRLQIEGPGAPGRAERVLAAIASTDPPPTRPCSRAFEEALRIGLREFGTRMPFGRDDHPYRATLRAALRRLAATHDGDLTTVSGDRLTTNSALEFELAWSRSEEIAGYLVWLRELARSIAPEDDGLLAFRSLVAADADPDTFDGVLTAARASAERCRAVAWR